VHAISRSSLYYTIKLDTISFISSAYVFSDFLLALLALEDGGSVLEELPEVGLRLGVGKVHQLEEEEEPLDALRLNEGVVDLATRTNITDTVHK
jgi:hypothetical protein